MVVAADANIRPRKVVSGRGRVLAQPLPVLTLDAPTHSFLKERELNNNDPRSARDSNSSCTCMLRRHGSRPAGAKRPALAQLEQLQRELSGAIARAVSLHEEVTREARRCQDLLTNEST